MGPGGTSGARGEVGKWDARHVTCCTAPGCAVHITRCAYAYCYGVPGHSPAKAEIQGVPQDTLHQECCGCVGVGAQPWLYSLSLHCMAVRQAVRHGPHAAERHHGGALWSHVHAHPRGSAALGHGVRHATGLRPLPGAAGTEHAPVPQVRQGEACCDPWSGH